MEPIMISLKILSTAAAMALIASMALPDKSIAQGAPGLKETMRAPSVGGGGGAPSGPRFSGGGAPPAAIGGGFRGGGGGVHIGGGAPGPRYSGGGGSYYGGGGYRHHHHGGGFFPGAVAGAVIGGALASQSYAYGPGYYPPSYGYYDDSYVDDGAVAIETAPGGDDVSYCRQRYRSYDVRSGTYLGNDGLRHPCP
jgi:BA14K-like protein